MVTTSGICGSDLHMYDGRTPLDKGTVVGHEIISRGFASGRLRIDDFGLAMSGPMNLLDNTGLLLEGKRLQRHRCSRAS